MRVIITGGSGLIGRALSANLAADGHEILLLSRNPDRVTGLPNSFGASSTERVRAARWDGHSAEGWGHLADGAGAIVNLAGESIAAGRWTPERKRRIRDSRVNAGRAVVEAVQAAASKPGLVIQSSGIGYYGPRGDEEITEKDRVGSDFLSQVCIDWEASTAPLDKLGLRRPVIRTGVVLSAQGGALPRMLLPFKLFAGGPLGGGRQWFPWIHIADEVSAIRFLIEHPQATGPFNLSAPNPLTNAQFSRLLGCVMGRPAFMPTPGLALRLLFGEMATVLLDGQQAVPQHLLELGFGFRFPEAEAALRDVLG
jgi:uncharacterized protein (TIGR01777 family)